MTIHVLDIPLAFTGRPDTLHPVLIQTDEKLVLIDCGYEGFADRLESAANRNGLSLKSLTDILITHHDIDHFGGLHELKARYPHVIVHSAALEKPLIEGTRPSLRLQQAEALFDNFPEEEKPRALVFQNSLRNVKPVTVNATFTPDTLLPFLPGVIAVHTPGHLPGHVSLYLPETRTLIAGDAVVVENGGLSMANPQFTLDLPAAVRSVRKLLALQPTRLVCYHGGVFTGNTQEQLQQLIIQYGKGD